MADAERQETTSFRNWCLRVVRSPWQHFLSKVVVLLNCIILSIYDSYEVEVFFFVFFIMEMLVKMMALGIVDTDRGYLRSNWNKFDVFINFGVMFDYILALFGVHLKIFRTLGPMRLLGRDTGMRGLVSGLLNILPVLWRIVVLCMFVIHIFSVVAVQLWAGQLRNRCFLADNVTSYNVSLSPYYESKYGEKIPFICSPDHNNGLQGCHDVPPYWQDGNTCSLPPPQHAPAVPAGATDDVNCVNWNLLYSVCHAGDLNPQMGSISFDNIGLAWIAIFQVITLEGWAQIMSFVMDSYSFWCFPFFIIVTIIGSFIMMNLCAVLIACKFSEEMQIDADQSADQSADAVSVIGLIKKLAHWLHEIFSKIYTCQQTVHPAPGYTITSQLFQNLLRDTIKKALISAADKVIMLAVLLSVLVMAVEYHGQPEEMTRTLKVINIFFIAIFFLEMVFKLLFLKWTYFLDKYNVFDFVLVIISLWELFSNADGKLSVLRAFRALRFVRLLYFSRYLRTQLLVLKRTVVKAAALFMLLVFTIFIFSVLGMQLFKGEFIFKTLHGDIVSDRKNFDTLLWAMVTVFEVLTIEDWNLVLYNAMAATSPWASLYFVALLLIGKHVLVNVVMGIVVRSFQEGRQERAQTGRSTENESLSLNTSGLDSDSILSLSGPSNSTESNTHPEEDSTTADAPENDSSLRKVQRWCKNHRDWSFYMLSPGNKFRVFCQRVTTHTVFEHLILLLILASCVTLAIERPGIASKERLILKTLDYTFCGLFLVEMLLKCLAQGLFIGKESYFRCSWNVLDGILVIISVIHILISLFSAGSDMLGILKVLRILRTLRPLRVIQRAPKLKLAVNALVASVKPIGNICLICCVFFVFYSIFGLQLFKGKFYSCVGQDMSNITNKSQCLSSGYQWQRKMYNFDSLGQALMSLFVMYSKDGWVNIMYDGLDAVGVNKQPVHNYNQWMLLFFLSFMVLSFLLLDLFIGALVEVFYQVQQEQKEMAQQQPQEGGEALQNEHDESEPYYTDYCPLRRSIHTLCTSSFMEVFMTIIIVVSVLMMGLEYHQQPLYMEKLTGYSFYVFTVIFSMEVLLKLAAFGCLRFIKDSWNLLDAAVVLASIIWIILNAVMRADRFGVDLSILRVCRVFRLARVMKDKKILVILKTIMKTLSQVGNICLLFMFFFFIFGVMGVELFGKQKCSEDHLCVGLNRHANFRHFGMALLTLYQVSTGDSWSEIMKNILRECQLKDNTCPSYLPWVTPLYFSFFVVLAQFVLMNLVVATVMQALEDSTEEVVKHDSQQTSEDEEQPSPNPSMDPPGK